MDSGISTWGTKVKTSAGKFMGWNTIYGRAGEHHLPYMTRIWFGRLRLHIFHRGDNDPDCHDHPWDFWTFPLTSYVEEVAVHDPDAQDEFMGGLSYEEWEDWVEGKVQHKFYRKIRQVVPAFRLSFRPATHCHRVLGRVAGGTGFSMDGETAGPEYRPGKIVTIVWRGGPGRQWGFLKNRDGKWCWVAWQEYVFGGGKDAPCE